MATSELYLFGSLPVTAAILFIAGKIRTERSASFEIIQLNLPKGKYRFTPYFLIHHQYIPPGLIASMGLNMLAIGPNFLRLPLKHTRGMFEGK